MARQNVFEGGFPMVRAESGVSTIGVATRHPFEPLAEGADAGAIGLFRSADHQRRPPST